MDKDLARIRRAAAGMNYGAGMTKYAGSLETLGDIADYLEELKERLDGVSERDGRQQDELRKLRAQRAAVRELFGVMSE